MAQPVERSHMAERYHKFTQLLACVRQLLTKTPEEHVSEAWRGVDPTTRAMSKLIPAEPLVGSPQETLCRVRVRFFLNANILRVVDKDAHCIYSDILLEPCRGLSLKRIRIKWGLYDCQIVHRDKTGLVKVILPRNPDFLSAAEVKYLSDSEGVLRIIEKPPTHIQQYRKYRMALLYRRDRWRASLPWLICLHYPWVCLKGVYRTTTETMQNVNQRIRWGKWSYMTLVHLGPVLLGPLLWHFSRWWMTLLPAMSLYLIASFFLFVQCPYSRKETWVKSK